MKVLNLLKNELFKQLAKKSFLICICFILAISIGYSIISEYAVVHWDKDRLMNYYLSSFAEGLNDAKRFAGYNDNYELYKDDFEEIIDYGLDLVRGYGALPYVKEFYNEEYTSEVLEKSYQNYYLKLMIDNEEIKDNELIKKHVIPEHIYSLSKEELTKLYNENEARIKTLDSILKDNDLNIIVKEYIEEYEEYKDESKKSFELKKENYKNNTDKLKQAEKVYEKEIFMYDYLLETLNELQKDDIKGIEYKYVIYYFYDLKTLLDDFKGNSIIAEEDSYPFNVYSSYEEYVRSKESYIKRTLEEADKLKYGIVNQIPYQKRGIRSLLSDVTDCSLVISFMIIAMGGGIVSNEFNSGTIRLLLTRPNKRWKVLLSKLLTIIIYSISYMALFILFGYITSFILLGINDLSIPMLEVINGSVVETSYIFYLFKNILIILSGILFCGILSFALSTLLNNTAFSVAFPIIFYFGFDAILRIFGISTLSKLFIYTFIPFLNLINFRNVEYILNVEDVLESNLSINYGLWILLINAIILIITSFIVFIKRDVKN